MPKYIKQLKLDYTAILALSLILSFTPLKILALVIILFVLARMLTIIKFGMLGRLCVAMLLCAAWTATLAAGAWLAKIELSVVCLLISHLTVLSLIVIINRRHIPTLIPSRAELTDSDDWLAIVAVILSLAVITLPVLQKPGIATIAPLVMWGGDNSSHINILKTDDLNAGYSIGEDNKVNLFGVLATYPQGWHVNAAFLKWTIDPILAIAQSPARLLTFYYLLCLIWLGSLIFLITRTALYIRTRLQPEQHKGAIISWSKLIIIVATVCVCTYAIVPLIAYGFQTQIAALIFTLLEIIFIANSYITRSTNERYASLLLAALALAGNSFCWLFLVPFCSLLLGIAFVHIIYTTKKMPPFFATLAFLLLFAAIIFQPAVQLLVKVPGYQEGILNQNGLTDKIDLLLLLAILAANSIVLLIFRKDWWVRVLYTSGVSALTFSIILLIYQISTIGELRYYYFKSLYAFLVLATPLLAAAMGLIFSTLANTLDKASIKFMSFFGAMSILSGLALGHSIRSPILNMLATSQLRGVSPVQAQAIADIINKNPNDSLHITSIGSCDRGDDVRTAQLAHSLAYNEEKNAISYSPNELLFASKEYLFGSMRDFITRERFHLIILVNDQLLGEQLKKNLGGISPAATFIELDTTSETEPFSQCPNRIHTLTQEELKSGLK